VLGLANVLQTVPSLALFGFLIPIPLIGGIGKRTAIVALVLYALLPILRNTLVGILGVDPAVRESAVAMGMTDRQLLWQVELPLAAPTILAGVRVATVTTVGTATIAAAIGGGGLGVFIFRGIASVDTTQILAGAVPAAILALLSDGGLGGELLFQASHHRRIQEFHRTGDPRRNHRAASGKSAPSACSAKTEPRRHAACSPSLARARHRPVSGVHRNRIYQYPQAQRG
jgi:osmoprotectant transport system permease protein